MIFLSQQKTQNIDYYLKLLKVLGALSKLYSTNTSPYLNYRSTEHLFCKAFHAENMALSDISVDAVKDNIGIGIKTFLENNSKSIQKVAEFNKIKHLYQHLESKSLIQKIAEVRNQRISITQEIKNLESSIYHCIVRSPGKIKLFEEPMDLIQLDSIKQIHQSSNNVIGFSDGKNDYSFNLSKSTLMKRFVTPKKYLEINVQILSDPFDLLEKFFEGEIKPSQLSFEKIRSDQEHVFLPLYSDKTKQVENKSGLNQWNAGGRGRHEDEVYIPIPRWIHSEFPNFFPPKDESFDMKMPNGDIMSMKVCQSGGKALMSNPNKELGKWILRDILKQPKGKLVTKNLLDEIGLDSVVIYKHSSKNFYMNFAKSNSFEKFKTKTLSSAQ